MVDYIGQTFGNYRLLRLLGQGSFADVYLGRHMYLKQAFVTGKQMTPTQVLAARKNVSPIVIPVTIPETPKQARSLLTYESRELCERVSPACVTGWAECLVCFFVGSETPRTHCVRGVSDPTNNGITFMQAL